MEAVYSVGGGNTATVAAFDKLGRACRVFVAHDLDADNRRLLREGRISVVLHNDLRADARLAMRLILQERGALPVEPARSVPIQVITPYNLPRVVLAGWLLIGNYFLRNRILGERDENTILSHGSPRHDALSSAFIRRSPARRLRVG